jgi:RNA polymerase sigma factor (sigma-70 family)
MSSRETYQFSMAAFQKGDERALEYVFSTHWREFVYFAKKYLSDLEAEDLCSEVMNRVWARRYDFDSISGLKAFIFLSIRNGAFDLIDKKKRESLAAKGYLYHKEQSMAHNETERMLGQVVEAGVLRRLHELQEKLPPQIRKVIQLTMEGESVSSISDKMGIARQVVHRYKDRGIQLLRGGIYSKDPWRVLVLLLVIASSTF